LYIMIKDFW